VDAVTDFVARLAGHGSGEQRDVVAGGGQTPGNLLDVELAAAPFGMTEISPVADRDVDAPIADGGS
jgi:hypothetical protein